MWLNNSMLHEEVKIIDENCNYYRQMLYCINYNEFNTRIIIIRFNEI